MCVNRLICKVVAIVLLVFPVAWVSPAEGQQDPIRIGLLAPLTGAAAGTGKDMRDGFLMYMDEIGYRAAGRRIEVIVEDTQGRPDIALTKTTKLVQQDRVRAMTGALLASTCYALAPLLTREKIPYLPLCAADDLTQRTPAPYLIRTTWTSSQTTHPFGEWVVKNTKIRKVVTIGLDYAFGYEVIGGFQKTFEEAGGQVIQKIWPPLGTTDFGPYIAQKGLSTCVMLPQRVVSRCRAGRFPQDPCGVRRSVWHRGGVPRVPDPIAMAGGISLSGLRA